MSHQPERKEKDCLNCGADLIGRYCHRCGQENIVTKQGFWSLTRHFIYDIFHFDGKFFHTLYYMFTRPGFVASEYVAGRRMSYVDPIRMYLFTSAVFFLIFFSMKSFEIGEKRDNVADSTSTEARMEAADKLERRAKRRPGDSVRFNRQIQMLRDTSKPLDIDTVVGRQGLLTFDGSNYNSLAEYDSAQKTLPKADRDGWFKKMLIKRSIVTAKKYSNGNQLVNSYMNTFLHQLPYLLFISLPFFALILKLLYVRRKEFYYSDHAVFTLYHFVFSFLVLLLIISISRLNDTQHWSVLEWITGLLYIAWPVYLYLQMRRFYGQKKRKTFGKFLLLNFIGLFLLVGLFTIFLLISLYKV